MVAPDGDGDASPTVRSASVPRLPRLPTHVVDRTRLFELLDTPAPLVVLRATTGFGKTTLQAMWAGNRAAIDTVAWVGLDDDDRDPVVFWTTILDALYDVGVRIDHEDDGQRAARRQVRRAIETSPSPRAETFGSRRAPGLDWIQSSSTRWTCCLTRMRSPIC